MIAPVATSAGRSLLLAHDFAFDYGGAERVTQLLAETFPEAGILVIGGEREVLRRMGIEERTRSLLPLGHLRAGYRTLSPFYPTLLRRIEAEVVLSSSYAFAHHVRARRLHVCYCHSPLRQIWSGFESYVQASDGLTSSGLRAFAKYLRRADVAAMNRVDSLVANGANVRRRIRQIYGRDAEVLRPPARADVFRPLPIEREDDLALVVARLVRPYKAIDDVLDAFWRLPYRLIVAGDGRDAAALRAAAPPHVEFVGHVGDEELCALYNRARVLLFPGEDDFGIVPLEAMACGTPVVALDAGGAQETVIDGVTGVRYARGELEKAVAAAMGRSWDHAAIRRHALTFGRDRFQAEMRRMVAGSAATTGREAAA